jgi:hypothetical protein
LVEGWPDSCPGRKVNYYLRKVLLEDFSKPVLIANVSLDKRKLATAPDLVQVALLGARGIEIIQIVDQGQRVA